MTLINNQTKPPPTKVVQKELNIKCHRGKERRRNWGNGFCPPKANHWAPVSGSFLGKEWIKNPMPWDKGGNSWEKKNGG